MGQYNNLKDKITVEIDADLEDLIPGYLRNKQNEIERMAAAMATSDFSAIALIAHGLKGNGAAYGFVPLSELGAAMEKAAGLQDGEAIGKLLEDMQAYLTQIEIVYIEC
ncbi:Hpt domain-containing protein [Paenibacillus aestuarii]|uniref:Hpt domain-containing protein n=1 Tax=Paenibacillus aestuarii TaxID=516965 RepID=A0ABW0KGT8_9BACL|nr:Hpt domain-containing protein [Paenibacillus aestuarii]